MIKFLDLEKINNRFRAEMDVRIKDVLDSGWYLQGRQNEIFKEEQVLSINFFLNKTEHNFCCTRSIKNGKSFYFSILKYR